MLMLRRDGFDTTS